MNGPSAHELKCMSAEELVRFLRGMAVWMESCLGMTGAVTRALCEAADRIENFEP